MVWKGYDWLIANGCRAVSLDELRDSALYEDLNDDEHPWKRSLESYLGDRTIKLTDPRSFRARLNKADAAEFERAHRTMALYARPGGVAQVLVYDNYVHSFFSIVDKNETKFVLRVVAKKYDLSCDEFGLQAPFSNAKDGQQWMSAANDFFVLIGSNQYRTLVK